MPQLLDVLADIHEHNVTRHLATTFRHAPPLADREAFASFLTTSVDASKSGAPDSPPVSSAQVLRKRLISLMNFARFSSSRTPSPSSGASARTPTLP